ncbi:MAG: SDR family oxidoreductase [Akkermansiaceae bacterium]|nr:SDR family oxidoreductase [Armatimonadota bacterium]
MNSQPLQNRVGFITGGARGIGYGIALRFAREGASVVIADINEPLARESAARVTAETGRAAIALRCDVTDRADVNAAIARTVAELGSLDILVSNAGICPFVEFLDLDNETWQKTIDVILTGGFNVGQAAARSMIARKTGGRIIYITSLSTIQAGSSQVDYAAAKSGEKMLMAGMAGALGKHGITVNAIAPGVIYTEMGAFHWDVPEHRKAFGEANPRGRLGEPKDIANAAVFLALDESEYITGTTIRVDGGHLAVG